MKLNFAIELFPHRCYGYVGSRVDIQLTENQAKFLKFIAVAANQRGDKTLNGCPLNRTGDVVKYVIDRMREECEKQMPDDLRHLLEKEEVKI